MPKYKRQITKLKPCPVCNAIGKDSPRIDTLTDFEFCERHYYEARETWKSIDKRMKFFADWLIAIGKTRHKYIT